MSKRNSIALSFDGLYHAMFPYRLDRLSQTQQEEAEDRNAMVVIYMMCSSHQKDLTGCKEVHQIFYITTARAIQAFLSCIKWAWELVAQVGPLHAGDDNKSSARQQSATRCSV